MPQGLKLLDSAQEGRGVGGGGEKEKEKREKYRTCAARRKTGLGWVHPLLLPFPPVFGAWVAPPCPARAKRELGGEKCPENGISGVGSCAGTGLSVCVCNACAQLPWVPTPELRKIPIQAALPLAAEPGMSSLTSVNLPRNT